MKTGLIITFALVQGIVFVALVMLYLVLGGNEEQAAQADGGGTNDLIMLGIGLFVTLIACAAAVLVPMALRRQAIEKFQSSGEQVELPLYVDASLTPAAQQLVGASLSWTIVGQAVLEGAAMLNLVLMVVDSNLLHVALSAICVIGIVLQTPTVGKKKQLIENAASSIR